MSKFLNKAGMVHFLEKIKEMNHGMRFIPSITVRFKTHKVTSDEPENTGEFIEDGVYYDNKIQFKINAPREWIEVAMKDENYKIILFHPSSRRKTWTSIDDDPILFSEVLFVASQFVGCFLMLWRKRYCRQG